MGLLPSLTLSMQTLPLLSLPTTAMYSQSCDYTTIPRSTAILTTNTSVYGPATTDLANCEIEQQIGPNIAVETRISGCATPLTTTSAEYVLVYSGEVIETPTATFVGGSTSRGSPVTIPGGDPTVISTLAPSLMVLTSSGAGAFVGQMTGSDLWFNISTAVVSACSGSTWPVTSCPTATITGVPYPSSDAMYVGLDFEVGYGELEISLTAVTVTDADSLSLLAYQLGASAALGIAGDTKNMCRNVTVVASEFCSPRGGGCGEFGKSTFDECYKPSSLLIQEYRGDNAFGPDSEIWATFDFVNPKSGDPIEVACEVANGIMEALLGFVMLFAWVVGPRRRSRRRRRRSWSHRPRRRRPERGESRGRSQVRMREHREFQKGRQLCSRRRLWWEAGRVPDRRIDQRFLQGESVYQRDDSGHRTDWTGIQRAQWIVGTDVKRDICSSTAIAHVVVLYDRCLRMHGRFLHKGDWLLDLFSIYHTMKIPTASIVIFPKVYQYNRFSQQTQNLLCSIVLEDSAPSLRTIFHVCLP
nr:hypothetical protein CFP56_64786 [Quercus suber]